MANEGKYIDRCPNIRAAGIRVPLDDIKKCFQIISLDDELEALGFQDVKEKKSYPLPKSEGKRYAGLYTDVRSMIQPPFKSEFQVLKEELEDFKNSRGNKASTAHVPDCLYNLFSSADVYQKTYGISTKSDIPVQEIVNPTKSFGQTMFENSLGHELYVRTHQDYNPGEQVNRRYTSPNFKPNKKFGMPTPWDETGIWAAKTIKWINNEEMCVVTQRQAEYVAHTQPQMGKVLETIHVLEDLVPNGHTFGKTEEQVFSLGEVLRYTEPSPEKKKQMDNFSFINKLRFILKHRDPEFPFEDFYDKLKSCDKESRNTISLDKLYQICNQYRVPVNSTLLEGLMKLTNILDEDNFVNYRKFFELINCNFDLPGVPKIDDIPNDQLCYETIHMSAENDLQKLHTSGEKPKKHSGVVVADDREKCDGLTVKALITPSAYIQHGIDCKDMYKPRSKTEIHELFKKARIELDDETFKKLWIEACGTDKNENVCVAAFQKVFNCKTSKV